MKQISRCKNIKTAFNGFLGIHSLVAVLIVQKYPFIQVKNNCESRENYNI